MLRKPDEIDQAIMAPARIGPLDRARTFIILLVLLHHSVINYTWFGHGDPMRWLGFDLVVLFNDSFFMALMFFISGLFVRESLMRKGSAIFLRDRAWRLGVPFLISVFVLMPIAYYPTFLRYHLPGTTDFNFLHFWWRTLTVGPWPSGPALRLRSTLRSSSWSTPTTTGWRISIRRRRCGKPVTASHLRRTAPQ